MPKGKGLGRMGGKGEIKGIRGINISTHNVARGKGKAVYTEKTSSDSIASYYAGGQ